MMHAGPLNILFLCTGNSARSILAESIVNRLGTDRFVAHSAGSFPKGEVHPQALRLLRSLNHPIEHLRSKSWDEFAAPGAPELDFIITVCDNAAGEACPVWPGRPITAHWSVPDPAIEGTEVQIALAFAEAYRMLETRIGLFLSLPFEALSSQSLKRRMDEIDSGPTLRNRRLEPLADGHRSGRCRVQGMPRTGRTADGRSRPGRPLPIGHEDGEAVGFGGLDGSGPDQMIRSVAVLSTFRGLGHGRRIVEAVADRAKADGVERLWLLTTSADRFFAALGWAVADRAEAPTSVRASEQFLGLCPASAVLMCRPLA